MAGNVAAVASGISNFGHHQAGKSKGVTLFMVGLGIVLLLSNGYIARGLEWIRGKTSGGTGGSGSGTGTGGSGSSGAGSGSAPTMTAPGGSANAAPPADVTIPSKFLFPGTPLPPGTPSGQLPPEITFPGGGKLPFRTVSGSG